MYIACTVALLNIRMSIKRCIRLGFAAFQIVKKNTIENIVPIVISVKHLFEQKHSPLLKDLLLCLKELMQVREVLCFLWLSYFWSMLDNFHGYDYGCDQGCNRLPGEKG